MLYMLRTPFIQSFHQYIPSMQFFVSHTSGRSLQIRICLFLSYFYTISDVSVNSIKPHCLNDYCVTWIADPPSSLNSLYRLIQKVVVIKLTIQYCRMAQKMKESPGEGEPTSDNKQPGSPKNRLAVLKRSTAKKGILRILLAKKACFHPLKPHLSKPIIILILPLFSCFQPGSLPVPRSGGAVQGKADWHWGCRG